MSTEQRLAALDILKVIVYIAIGISGFLMVDVYRGQRDTTDKILNKVENIESRVIRMEYELKLK